MLQGLGVEGCQGFGLRDSELAIKCPNIEAARDIVFERVGPGAFRAPTTL